MDTPKNEAIKDAFEGLLLKVLTAGEQVLVTDKETGDKYETRVEPSAAILGVIRAYLKDYPPAARPLAAGKTTGALERFAKKLPFETPAQDYR